MKNLIVLIAACLLPLLGMTQKIGVSLSGGGALGYAHIGFLQAMDEAGIKPDCVVGTSMGAIMGMMYCAGYTPQEIFKIVKREKMDHLMTIARPSLKPSWGGMVSTESVQKVLLKYVPHNNFDSLLLPFYCCATDMNNLVPRYQRHGGNLVQYVMASSAVPGAFAPVKVGGTYFVDGGVLDNMPIQPLLDEGCELTIASSLIIEKPRNNLDPFTIFLHALSLAPYLTGIGNADQFDYVVDLDLEDFWMLDFDKLEQLYSLGYAAGKSYFSTHTIINK